MATSVEQTDRLAYFPPPEDNATNVQDYLIFLIGGNPGLISYYEPFLETLHALLCSSSAAETARFYVYGSSLAGFENSHLANGEESPGPLGLPDQIQNTEDLIYNEITLYRKANSFEKPPPKVILIGHSVGAYILLEMIRRHRKRIEDFDDEDFDLIGGILLFPTIVNIAKSPLGLFASVSKHDGLRSSIRELTCVDFPTNPAHCPDRRGFRTILDKSHPYSCSLPHHQVDYEIPRACSPNYRPLCQEPNGSEARPVRRPSFS